MNTVFVTYIKHHHETYYFLRTLVVERHFTQAQKRDTVHAAPAQKAKIKNQLGLDKKQAAALKASGREYKAGKEQIENDPRLSDADKKAKMKDLKKARKATKDSVLTPEQKEKAKALRAAK